MDFFQNENILCKCLKQTKDFYRPYDPGSYLYNLLLRFENNQKYNDDFIELVYVTLSAWNMNTRGAKLNEFTAFKESIISSKKIIESLQNSNINNITDEYIRTRLYYLFFGLKLVDDTKPPLVTFSKTMHFFIPELVVPIDRTYTLRYFYGNVNVPKNHERQFTMFMDIEEQYSLYAKKIDLAKYYDQIWNRNIPKIMDNIIIGYLRGKESKT